MKLQQSELLSFRPLAGVFTGMLLAAAGSIFFLNVPVKTEAVGKVSSQNLTASKLAYIRFRNGMGTDDRGLFTSEADGTAPSTLIPNPGELGPREPDWSPDGTRIVYAQKFGGAQLNDIYVIDVSGGGTVNLTNTAADDELDPSWSVTGKIAFELGAAGIWTMNADGSGRALFAAITRPSPADPAWSPNGRKLAFVSGGEIWVIDANGANQRQVTTNATVDSEPTWSPDGSKIMFAKQNSGLAVINADGTNEVGVTTGTDVGPAWSPDGTTIAFQRTSTAPGLYTMDPDGSDQVRILSAGSSFPLPCCDIKYGHAAWQRFLQPRTTFDFDGDGRSDPAIFRSALGDWWYFASADNSFRAVHWGVSSDVLAPADYDADLKTDIAVWRPSDGNFYIINSFDNTIRVENFGIAGDVPTGGDYDGDGRADLAVYRSGAQSTFYYRGSMGNPQGNVTFVPWGIAGDKPVVGDYDGDGRTDAAVFRPSDRTWYVQRSSDDQLFAVAWGIADDVLVPADYDGDSKTDLGVFRDGVWYLYRSTQGVGIFQFGIENDIPVPADYDGDGRSDAAIFRAGVWWVLNSGTSTASAVQFGVGSDTPVEAAFVR